MEILSIRTLAFLLLAGLVMTACQKDDDEDPENEEELITTVELTFTDPAGNAQTFTARDLDGPGGDPIEIETITLAANTTYTVTPVYLNEQEDPAEDITEEVEEEDEEHLICYSISGNVFDPNIVQDTDGEGKVFGLSTDLTSLGAGNGSLRHTLKHEPDKDAADPCATGETDVEIDFPVVIN